MSLTATPWLIYMFLDVFEQQWSSVAQSNKLCQASATQTIQRVVGFGLFTGFVGSEENDFNY